jgi:hypothetical protein
MFFDFMTSRTGLFLKKPLVHELAEAIDGLASMGEAHLLRISGGLLPALPGMNGPINTRRMDEIRMMLETFQNALVVDGDNDDDNQVLLGPQNDGNRVNGNIPGPLAVAQSRAQVETMIEISRVISSHLGDERLQKNSAALIAELQSVAQMVAVEVLEIRGSRAMRSVLRIGS